MKGSHSRQGGVTSALGANDRGVTHAGESLTPLTPGWRSLHPWMAILASVGGDRYTTGWRRSIPGWRSMHPGMVIINPRCLSLHPWMEIDASRDGIQGWRSMHPGMAIAASLDGDRFVLGWRSMHPGMAIIATRDGDGCIPGWWSSIPGGYHCIPGWRSMHLAMASRVGDRCSRDGAGDQSIPVGDQGWRSMHPRMAINHCNPGWR